MNEPITPELIRSEAASLRHTGRGNYADFMELVADQMQLLETTLKDPTLLHHAMLRGTVPKLSWRQVCHLSGEVYNGEEAQLSEIVRLREELQTANTKLAQYDAACEAMAMRVLGQERYDNSACQAHPMELIEIRVNELKTELQTQRMQAELYRMELANYV